MRAREDTKLSMKLVTLTLFLLIYVHFVACAWFYIIDNFGESNDWVPPLNTLDMSVIKLYEEGHIYKYWVCVYYSVIMLAGGDVYPNTSLHDSVAGMFILSGAIVTAIMFGNMAVIITSLNKKVVEF